MHPESPTLTGRMNLEFTYFLEIIPGCLVSEWFTHLPCLLQSFNFKSRKWYLSYHLLSWCFALPGKLIKWGENVHSQQRTSFFMARHKIIVVDRGGLICTLRYACLQRLAENSILKCQIHLLSSAFFTLLSAVFYQRINVSSILAPVIQFQEPEMIFVM